MRLRMTKSVLWFFAGAGLTVFVMRLIHGPGSVTALTDIIPWGLWKGGGVVALVAIGGAGFTLAMFVYIFGWKKFEPVVRGAVLLALLCYGSVGLGLTIDIGIWWRIVFPVFHWQFHSVLFEVAWCIMLYLGVLFFEFSHNITERCRWHRLSDVLHKLTVGFVVAGISLSTLHQSSLGTLFLATPFRLHPLWHTEFLPLLFFVSSIGVGCLTISIATLLVHRLYNAEPPMTAISGLGRIAAWVMGAYLVLKLGEVLISGEGALLLVPSWDTANFWIELSLSAVLPVTLLSFSKYRSSPTAMLWIGIMATAGLSLNRVNVAGLATLSTTHATYVPSWTEWAVTLGVLSAAALIFLYATELFGLFRGVSREGSRFSYPPGQLDHTDGPALFFSAQRLGEARVYSLVFMIGMATSFGCLSDDAVFGVSPQTTRTQLPRVVQRPADVQAPEAAEDTALAYLELDGNRDGRAVLFAHDAHASRVSQDGHTCSSCHHMNRPEEKATTCAACHKDVYLPTDIFDHELHKERHGQNAGCSRCHTDSAQPKTRETAHPCQACHESMRAPDPFVQPAAETPRDLAAGYMDAMHGLCVTCHKKAAERPETREDLGLCATCHTQTNAATNSHERQPSTPEVNR